MRKLKAITIKGLFGRHDYTLNFDEKGGFTMLAAPNGYGKSTILKIIRAIASGNVFFFWNLDFNEIEVDYEESKMHNSGEMRTFWISKLPLHQLKDPEFFERHDPNFQDLVNNYFKTFETNERYNHGTDFLGFIDPNKEDPIQKEFNTFYSKFTNHTRNRYFIRFHDRHIRTIDLIDQDIWDLQTEIAKQDGNPNISQISLSDLFYARSPEHIALFTKTIGQLHSFVNDTALYHIYIGANREIAGTNIPSNTSYTATDISKLIASLGELEKERNAKVSRYIDSDIVRRILRAVNDNSLKPKAVKEQINATLQEIAELKEMNERYGIFSDENSRATDVGVSEILESKNTTALTIINQVLKLNAEKLSTFEDYTNMLALFKQSLDDMLNYIKVKPSINGLTIEAEDPKTKQMRELPLEAISSGEQQLIVLLGIILFCNQTAALKPECKSLDPDSETYTGSKLLVLLDEPEISMHPAWQEDLAKFLWEVKENYDRDFIIATHAPTFIGRRWSHAYELADLARNNELEG